MPLVEWTAAKSDVLRAFLAKDPVQNAYALGLLEEHGLGDSSRPEAAAFFGWSQDETLTGVAVVGGEGGLVIPCAFDPAVATEMGKAFQDRCRVRSALGERYAVDGFLRGLGSSLVRWSRPQRLFAASADDLGPFVTADLRPAARADLAQLVALGAAALKESLGEDPYQLQPEAFERRIEARLAAGRTWVLSEGSRIVVKIDVGPLSRHAAEFEGLYTVPEARGRGLGTRALGQLARSMLGSLPRVVIRVDDRDAGLAAACRKVGFTPMRPQRLVILN